MTTSSWAMWPATTCPARNGNDTLKGGAEGDDISGGKGDDTLWGETGDDTLAGGEGVNLLIGGDGADTFDGTNGWSVVSYETSTSSVRVDLGVSTNNGGDAVGDSYININAVFGSAHDDTLIANNFGSFLDGKTGNDSLVGGIGIDTLVGGAGDDTYQVGANDGIVEEAGGGTDTVFSAESLTLAANVENLILIGTAVNGTGNDDANILTGNGEANVLTGLGGNDLYRVGSGDRVVEAVDGGNDTVESSVSYTLEANVENLILTGTALEGFGNGGANYIQGNDGSNGLFGQGGADTLAGGGGDDKYYVGSDGLAIILEAADAGNDYVVVDNDYTLGANIEELYADTSKPAHALRLTGNALANVIGGNDGDNTLDGGGGADTLEGFLGNDTYIVDNAGDVITEEVDGGRDTAVVSLNFSMGSLANVEIIRLADGTEATRLDRRRRRQLAHRQHQLQHHRRRSRRRYHGRRRRQRRVHRGQRRRRRDRDGRGRLPGCHPDQHQLYARGQPRRGILDCHRHRGDRSHR